MKKILSLILVLALSVCMFASCAEKKVTPDDGTTDGEVTTEGKADDTTAEKKETTAEETTVAPEPEEEWVLAEGYKFFNREGAEIDPAEGEDWKLFPYWEGYCNTQIYDSIGQSYGFYVTVDIECSKFRVWFGNGGENGHTNILVYCDDTLMGTWNATDQFDGFPWVTDDYAVEPGVHTIKVLTGEPLTPETWNGCTFNVVEYVK